MKCVECDAEVVEDYKFCPECGAPTRSDTDVADKANEADQDLLPEGEIEQVPAIHGEENESEVQESPRWYETGWLWFWLIIFYPVGIYGLVKRYIVPKAQKWIWIGLGVFLVIAAINNKSNPSSRPSTAGAWIDKGTLYCLSESRFDEQFEMLAQGINKYAYGCGVTNKSLSVAISDIKLLSGKAKVRVRSSGTVYWVAAESVHR
ncbi:zinc-ribbon domain-containing protein [Alcanivorax sp. IL2]|uniref:zinc-ribbon domain-containing protein n=1 Tax=Alcanivorax sp. IL2 TaxID=3396310 RepID=UPI0039C0F137